MNQPQPVKDASHLYEVERRAYHAERPGFRIAELQLSAKQKVPWHTHTNISDTFYVVTNGGTTSLTFLILQGVGEYDFVPLLGTK